MTTFGGELRKIRESRKMSQVKFARQLNVNPSTYYAVEVGTMSGKTKSAKKILQSDVMSLEEKKQLSKFSRKEVKQGAIKITAADRLAYQRRKNEEYEKEMMK